MGLDAGYGIGSLKPGVCTSSTRPASPYVGQTIYMTDTDETAVWEGTYWEGLNRGRDRNVIINGAMQVAQRGTSVAGVNGSVGYNTADRWKINLGAGTFTQSIENDAPTGSGLRKSLKMLCTTAGTPLGSTVQNWVGQVLEGQNLQQFAKGTASAKQFSWSFWVKSNVTGTYIAELYDANNNRTVSTSYTISASATWEKKTLSIPADTTGAFNNDNGTSLFAVFWIGAGSDSSSGTLNTTWNNVVTANRAVGQTNLASAINNYWQVTGIQLEVGSVATPFEFEDYGVTLSKCKRYFYTIPVNGLTVYNPYWNVGLSGGGQWANYNHPVEMRAVPTLRNSSGGTSVSFVYARNDAGVSSTVNLAESTMSTSSIVQLLYSSTNNSGSLLAVSYTTGMNNAVTYLSAEL